MKLLNWHMYCMWGVGGEGGGGRMPPRQAELTTLNGWYVFWSVVGAGGSP